MPTVKDVAEQVKFLLEHGRADEKAVLVLPRVQNRRKQKNPQKRFVLMCDDDLAARFYAQKDRWLELAINKTVALDLMVSMWERTKDEQIRGMAEVGHAGDKEHSDVQEG